MPDGSVFKLADKEAIHNHALQMHALLVAMHGVLPDHCITVLTPWQADSVRSRLLDMAMAENKALLTTLGLN